MSNRPKFDETTSTFLRDAYVDAVEEHGGAAKVTKEFNDLFFAKMRGTEALADFSVPQIRAKLQNLDVYVPHAPRQEPKKKGKTKAVLLAEFSQLSGVELASGMKLTIADIEALTERFTALTAGKEEG